MKINSINNISFGMAKFTPAMKDFIRYAAVDCKTGTQLCEYDKCIKFLNNIFPEKTLDIKTGYKKPKTIIEKIFPIIQDKIYLDKKLVGAINLEDKMNYCNRLIACANSLVEIFYWKKPDMPIVRFDKFIG